MKIYQNSVYKIIQMWLNETCCYKIQANLDLDKVTQINFFIYSRTESSHSPGKLS